MHATAQHLADISPATKAFWPLRKIFCTIAGVPWRGSNHTDPDRSIVLAKIRHRLEEANVYKIHPNRTDIKDHDIDAIPNILEVRLHCPYICTN